MYYVLYTTSGLEEKTENYIKKLVPGNLYVRCFHPVRHMKKVFRGSIKDIYENLIPGYIFVESDRFMDFYDELKRNPIHTRVIGKDQSGKDIEFYALSDDEVDWLNKLTGMYLLAERKKKDVEEKVVAEISKIDFKENDIVVLSGPLQNVEGKIIKFNLHKRRAEVEIDFMGRKTVVFMGIEFMKKSGKQPSGDSDEKNVEG
ncbi:MAG: hypothetical protein K6G24_06670 [Lachnospiraceae bacterium]|nr:hypothetical protein [Lachnospiraceae bacterium]